MSSSIDTMRRSAADKGTRHESILSTSTNGVASLNIYSGDSLVDSLCFCDVEIPLLSYHQTMYRPLYAFVGPGRSKPHYEGGSEKEYSHCSSSFFRDMKKCTLNCRRYSRTSLMMMAQAKLGGRIPSLNGRRAPRESSYHGPSHARFIDEYHVLQSVCISCQSPSRGEQINSRNVSKIGILYGSHTIRVTEWLFHLAKTGKQFAKLDCPDTS